MERYTEKHYTGNGHYLLCSGTCETLNCGDCGILDKIVDRLAAYEDTGLTPEEFQQMRWIPVEERLPEKENAQVLMTDGEGCYISSRNNMVRFLDCEGIFIPGKAGAGVKVTHWMHLPQPPKEEIL